MLTQKFLKILKISSLALGTLLLNHCGVKDPQVEEQRSGKVDASHLTFTSVDSYFNLTAGGSVHEYQGSLIVWNPKADHTFVSQVMVEGAKSKAAEKEYKKAAAIDRQLSEVQKTLKLSNEKLHEKNDDKVQAFYAEQSEPLKASTQVWVEKNLRTDMKVQFEEYCEVRLLRFATSQFVRENEFSSRPSPLGLCEAFYRQKSLFDHRSCQTLEAVKGNYFDCFWNAVLSSNLPKYKNNSIIKPTALNPEEVEVLRTKIAAIKALEAKDLDGIMSFGKVLDGFFIKFKNGNKFNMSPFSKSIQDPTGFFQDVQNSLLILTENKTSESGMVFTFNDRLFNFHLIVNAAQPKANNEQNIAFEASKLNLGSILGEQTPDFSIKEEDKAALLKSISILEKQEEALKAQALYSKDGIMVPVSDEKLNVWTNSKIAAANLLYNHNLAYALLGQLHLKLEFKNDVLELEFKLDDSAEKPARACFDLMRSVSLPCEDSTDHFPLELSFDKQTGKVAFSTSLADPKAFGFKVIDPSSAAKFQNIPESDLTGKTLSFELYPRRYGELVDLMTGSLYIRQDQKELFQGSLTLSTTVVAK